MTGVDLLVLAADRGSREVGKNVDREIADAWSQML
jgi:hypothetical protein